MMHHDGDAKKTPMAGFPIVIPEIMDRIYVFEVYGESLYEGLQFARA